MVQKHYLKKWKYPPWTLQLNEKYSKYRAQTLQIQKMIWQQNIENIGLKKKNIGSNIANTKHYLTTKRKILKISASNIANTKHYLTPIVSAGFESDIIQDQPETNIFTWGIFWCSINAHEVHDVHKCFSSFELGGGGIIAGVIWQLGNLHLREFEYKVASLRQQTSAIDRKFSRRIFNPGNARDCTDRQER